MKKHLYLLSFILFPYMLLAQVAPTITNMQNYNAGDLFQHVNCDPTIVAPGASGPNQHWNFVNLLALDTTTTRIIAPSSTLYASSYPSATFVQTTDPGTYWFYNKSANSNDLVGIVDSAGGYTMNYSSNWMKAAVRPFNYLDIVTDTFANSVNAGIITLNGGGTVTIEADAWGMLHLPSTDYSDVLRVKTVISQHDSVLVPIPTYLHVNRVVYAYYANSFSMPLLIWDSTTINGYVDDTSKSVMYYRVPPASTKNIIATNPAFSGRLFQTNLILNGQFEQGVPYKTELLSMDGRKIYSAVFTADKGIQSLDLQYEPAQGIYVVTVMKTNDVNSLQILKLVKE